MTAAKLGSEVKAAIRRLKKRRLDIENAEALLETKHAAHQLLFEDLGNA